MSNFSKDFSGIADMLHGAADKLGEVASRVDEHDAAMNARIEQAVAALGGAATFHNATSANQQATPADVARDRDRAQKVVTEVSAIDAEWKAQVDKRLDEHGEKLKTSEGHLHTMWEALGIDDNGKSKRLDDIETAQVATAEEIKKIKASVATYDERFEKLEKNGKFDVVWFVILVVVGLLLGAIVGYVVGAWVIGLMVGSVIGAIAGYVAGVSGGSVSLPKKGDHAA